jgi:putative nucleotidyltransferase with HDIG domain
MDDAATSHDSISIQDTAEALAQAMRVWDDDSYGHSVRTAEYAEAIARELGLNDEGTEQVRIGALLHDIGKMGVDLDVLKKPARLDERELEFVHLHPEMGRSILERVLPASIVACAASHHEQPDGGGYPHGLREAEIPIGALICRVADVLDSLTTPQTYRPAMTLEQALAELQDGAGTRYSQRVVGALLALIDSDRLAVAA